jgi:nitrite reductase (NADH) large subunit
MTRAHVVVVGNGMTGLRFLEELDCSRFAVTVIGAEPEPAYNRVLLSSLLAGEISTDDVMMRPRSWYADRGLDLRTGVRVTALDVARRELQLSDGGIVSFDSLVLATGARPIRLKMPGDHLTGVMTFRTSADVEALRTAAATGAPAVVIGGGLLGIEAAHGLARAGIDVTIVHIMDRLMERQLDAGGAAVLRGALEEKGVRFALSSESYSILGASHVEGLALKDGRHIDCGLVVMAIGVRADTALAESGGVLTRRGIVVDDTMQTSAPGIYAIGDCAEHRGICYGLIEPAYEQARVAAGVLGGGPQRYQGSVMATNLKVSGVPVFSAGDFEGDDSTEPIVVTDQVTPSYRKLVIRDGRLMGAAFVGDTHDALWYADLIRQGSGITPFRESLAFGRAHAEAVQ